MTGYEFAREWPGPLAKLEFTSPKPLLPASTISFLHSAGLPHTFTISCSQIVTFSTIPIAVPLRATWDAQIHDWAMPFDWVRFWRLGDITYTQASAWLCVEEVTGRVFAIDVEIDRPVYLVAESIMNLAISTLHWLRWYNQNNGAVTSLDDLRRAFAADQAFNAQEIAAYWGLFIANESESGIEDLAITYS